jgi:tRNA-modifying protein YgfZ
MNDVRALAVGRWHWNGWLNPKGRLIALFALLRLAEDEFFAVLADYPAQDLLPMLQRFVFRSKVRLQVVDDLVACADLEPATTDGVAPDAMHGTRESGLRLDFSGNRVNRHLLLLPASGAPAADADSDAQWLFFDLAHGLPRLPPSERESWTPQMLSLDRLHAFSLKKGCYPGQEIVARTHYLGQARRGLSRVRGDGLRLGAVLMDDQSATIGSLICVTPDGENGLAVLQLDKRAPAAWIDDRRVELPDFLEGLQRPV